MTRLLALLALLPIGCTHRTAPTACVPPDGTYEVVFTPMGDTCGFGIAPTLVTAHDWSELVDPTCVGAPDVAPGECSAAASGTCNGNSVEWFFRYDSPSRYHGELSVTTPSGCGALFDFTLTRQ